MSTARSRVTFVIGAALAAVAGLMFLLYYGVIDFFIGFLAGIKAFTAAVLGGIGSLPGAMLGGIADRPDRGVLVGLFLDRVQGCRRVLDPHSRADFPADRLAGPARGREGVRTRTRVPRDSKRREPLDLPRRAEGSRHRRARGVRSVRSADRHPHRQGPTGALICSTRFGALAAIVAAVFAGRLIWIAARARSRRFARRSGPPPGCGAPHRDWLSTPALRRWCSRSPCRSFSTPTVICSISRC